MLGFERTVRRVREGLFDACGTKHGVVGERNDNRSGCRGQSAESVVRKTEDTKLRMLVEVGGRAISQSGSGRKADDSSCPRAVRKMINDQHAARRIVSLVLLVTSWRPSSRRPTPPPFEEVCDEMNTIMRWIWSGFFRLIRACRYTGAGCSKANMQPVVAIIRECILQRRSTCVTAEYGSSQLVSRVHWAQE